jgi:hypothetical protein
MTSLLRSALYGLVLLLPATAQEPNPTGHYEGVLHAPGHEVQLTLDLDRNAKQKWIGSMSLDPGPKNLPVRDVAVTADSVKWILSPLPNAPSFDGKWDKDAKTINGTATLGKDALAFDAKRTGDAKISLPVSTPVGRDLEGKWIGSVEIPGQPLRVELDLKHDEEGKGVAILTSVDQNNTALPVDSVTRSGEDLAFDVKIVNGSYAGKTNSDKSEINGIWTQGGKPFALNFRRAGATAPAPDKASTLPK